MQTEIEIERVDGEVTASVRGWNATHVLFDAFDHDTRKWRLNMSRPILPFMLDYGLFGEPA